MSGIIAFAEVQYRRRNAKGKIEWMEEIIKKRSNQSDRGFIRHCDKLIKSHDKGILFGRDISTKKAGAKFFSQSETDITEKVRGFESLENIRV